jgi:glycerophosphoryl diester phosphodiesterase
MSFNSIEVQGHRGFRGMFPENTLPAFIGAVNVGVTAIELDVVISKDHQVVVSHEAWMNASICTQPNGNPITKALEKQFNLYQMPYAEIKNFDCGKIGHPEFPLQQKTPAFKPLLAEVFQEIESIIKNKNLSPINYNIEIKTEQDTLLFNPPPNIFVDLVYNEIIKYKLLERVSMQSFDVTILKTMRKRDSNISIGLLVENNESVNTNIQNLGFNPDVYSPDYNLLNDAMASEIKEKGLRLIPWTVNNTIDMQKMLALEVDGIITDYPDRLITLLNTNK